MMGSGSPKNGSPVTDSERRRRGARFTESNVREILEFFPGLACCCQGGTIRTMNYHGCRLLGCTDTGVFLERSVDDLFADEYRGMGLVDHVLETRTPTLAMMRRADGSNVGVEVRVQWTRELGPDSTVVRAEDVSHRMGLSSDILSSEARFRSLVDNALAMICACEEGAVKYINKAGLSLLRAADRKEIIGKPIADLFHADYREVFSTSDALKALFEEHALFPAKLARVDGTSVDVHVFLTLDTEKDGRLMLEIRDITQHRNAVMALHRLNQDLERKVIERTRELSEEVELRRRAEEQLRHLATHDALTGLPNRRLLMDRLETVIRHAHRGRKKVSVLFIDLDGFKQINDVHGHHAGDVVLKVVAERLVDQARETDVVARLGGDEFVLVYTDIQENAEAATLAGRILAALAEKIPLPNGQAGGIGGSIGVAFYPDDGDDGEAVMKAADDIMYAVKRQGKNSYLFAGSVAEVDGTG